jgi:hypothetical protein
MKEPASRPSWATSPLLGLYFVATLMTAVLLTVIIIQQYCKSEREHFFTITIPSNKDADEGDSDESTGLLSMQTYQAGGGA